MASNRKPVVYQERGGVRDASFKVEVLIDCWPGEPRPDHFLLQALQLTGLPDDFEEVGARSFGCWRWERGYSEEEAARRDREALFAALKLIYGDGRGHVRAAACRVMEKLCCRNCGGLLPWEGTFPQIRQEDGCTITFLGRGKEFTCPACGHYELRADAA